MNHVISIRYPQWQRFQSPIKEVCKKIYIIVRDRTYKVKSWMRSNLSNIISNKEGIINLNRVKLFLMMHIVERKD